MQTFAKYGIYMLIYSLLTAPVGYVLYLNDGEFGCTIWLYLPIAALKLCLSWWFLGKFHLSFIEKMSILTFAVALRLALGAPWIFIIMGFTLFHSEKSKVAQIPASVCKSTY